MESQTLEVIDAQVENLVVRRKPSVVLEEAREAASALQSVIAAKPKKVMFNGEQYLEFEDWQTIARFYGITSEVESTAFVDYGGVKGFSARAVVKRADSVQISAAESECLNDEPNWVSKPLFQLKSMAQTRAQAKALRNVLSWVVVLAGYKATPAEELQTESVSNDKTHSTASASAKPQVSADGHTKVKKVTDKPGEKKPGRVLFEDGRDLSTFDDKLIADAKTALAEGWTVIPKTDTKKKGDKEYVNLVGLERVVVKEAALPLEDTEPVGTLEKVLFTQHVTPEGKSAYWKIQTDKRLYVTNVEGHSVVAKLAKDNDKRVIVEFEPTQNPQGLHNIVKKISEAEAAAA